VVFARLRNLEKVRSQSVWLGVPRTPGVHVPAAWPY